MSTSTIPTTMRAMRVQPSPDVDKPWSPTNPAPSTSLNLDTIPTPHPKSPDELLVRVKASTIIRDTLTWPEMYEHAHAVPGHDFAGVVVEVFGSSGDDTDEKSKVGDEVYGMVHAGRGGCWGEYVLVRSGECALKPARLSWEEAASIPLSALTAWQALFQHGGVREPAGLDLSSTGAPSTVATRTHGVFITGATGGVGVWLVQLARLAGCRVVGGTTSRARNEAFLKDLGVDEVYEYEDSALKPTVLHSFDTVIDTVGGTPLEQCWSLVNPSGSLVSIDSASYDFEKTHAHSNTRAEAQETKIKTKWFIVEPSSGDLDRISRAIETGHLKTFVAERYPLDRAVEAYDKCHSNSGGRGKIVLTL